MVKKKKIKKKDIDDFDPIFIPVGYDSYREGKVFVLKTEVKILEAIKSVNKIRELQKQKKTLRLELKKIVSEILDLLYNVRSFMPLIRNFPLTRYEKVMSVSLKYQDKDKSISFSKSLKQSATDDLDKELKEIQEKLSMLTSSRESL